MAEWASLQQQTHFSLLRGLSSPARLVKRCKSLGMKTVAVTDLGSLAATVQLQKECKKAELKPILGCTFFVCGGDQKEKTTENTKLSHLCVLAKSEQGWKGLVKASSAANHPDHFHIRPRLDLSTLASHAQGCWVAFSGFPGSELGDLVFSDPGKAYAARTYAEARALVREDWKTVLTERAGLYQELFGEGNFFLAVQLIDRENMPAVDILAHAMRIISRRTNIPRLATANTFYPAREDAQDQRVLLCSSLQTDLASMQGSRHEAEDIGVSHFFRSNRYSVPSVEEMGALHTGEESELANTLLVTEMCEAYSILGRPRLLRFKTPHGESADQYLRFLCERGWKEKFARKLPRERWPEYAERVKHELTVIGDAKLADYFLIVQDYCRWAREQGWRLGRGRGSAAGCMLSNLVGITTEVDPIEYNLLFERFYNSGRNTSDRISLPDIDVDFPVSKREQVVNYIREKYGRDLVGQMVTFQRMQGRGALKDVLRAHRACTFEEQNLITTHIPDESSISDQLQEMKEETGESSIIGWALEHHAKELAPWCVQKEDGSLEGPMAAYFAQAIRMEGTKRAQSRHPAGVVISAEPLAECCPMVYDKSTKEMIAGLEMNDLEAMGHTKFDVLSIAVLDKLMGAISILRTGKLTI